MSLRSLARRMQSLWVAPAYDIRCSFPAGAEGDQGAETLQMLRLPVAACLMVCG